MRSILPILPIVVGLLGGAPAALAQDDPDDFPDDDFPDDEDVDLDAYDSERDPEAPLTPEEITDEDLAQTILIVPLAGETSESIGVGVLLEGYLQSALDNTDRFTVLGLPECPRVEDVDAELYYEGCPAGDELGCQFVIGEVAGVDRVVSGRVTVLAEGRYRIVVTILDVAEANLEFSYPLDLAEGEETLLPRTVELALDRLRREEILAPYRDRLEQQDAQRQAMAEARTEEERRLVKRMGLEPDVSGVERAVRDAEDRDVQISQDDVDEIKSAEGVAREWDSLGITERQYISYRNSGLEFDRWRWRWAGHRLQILGSFQVGFIGGGTGLRYYGAYLLDPELQNVVDTYSWQRVDSGSSITLGVSGGLGILRNLDVEVGAWWARSTVAVKLFSGDTIEGDGGELEPNPQNHPPPDFTSQTINLWGGEVMVRYFILTVPVIRPSVAAGMGWVLYPNLYNDPEIDDDAETPPPPIRGRFTTYRRLVDFGVVLEPGVQIDVGKHLGIFLRVPISIGLSPSRVASSGDLPRPLLTPDEPGNAPFGTVRVVVGVQGRVLGLPVQPRIGGDDDVLDEDN